MSIDVIMHLPAKRITKHQMMLQVTPFGSSSGRKNKSLPCVDRFFYLFRVKLIFQSIILYRESLKYHKCCCSVGCLDKSRPHSLPSFNSFQLITQSCRRWMSSMLQTYFIIKIVFVINHGLLGSIPKDFKYSIHQSYFSFFHRGTGRPCSE